MKLRSCPPKIALAFSVLGALITPTFALPTAKNHFRPDRVPPPLEAIREEASNPPFRYAEVPVELKEGTAVPEPALVPNHLLDDEIIGRAYNHEARPPHSVASAIKDRYDAAEDARAEQEPYEIDDTVPTEKGGALSGLTGEDEEFTQLVQSAPSIPEEGQQEAQVEPENPDFEEEFNYYTQKVGDKHPARVLEYLDARFEYCSKDSRRSQDERLDEAGVTGPYCKIVEEPTPAAEPREPVPDRFDGYVKVPIIPDNTAAAEDIDGANIYTHLQNRFKPALATTGDTPDYEVPAHLLPEALLDAEEEDPEEYIDRRTTHRLTVLDIKADGPPSAAVPEAAAAKAEAPLSLPEVTSPIAPTYITPAEHVRIPRPAIQN